MDAYLEIVRADGSLERHPIEGDRVTVGRSPMAGIPVPDAGDMEPEHLLVAPRAEGCWVSVADGSTARVRGEDFEHGMLAWGTEIEVGSLKLRVADQLPHEVKQGEKPVSAPVLIAMFIVIPLAGWLLLSGPSDRLDEAPTGDPPTLFARDVTCPESGTARSRAESSAEAAIARAERYPFAAQDGVDAARLYREAEACFRALGASEEATGVERARVRLEERIDQDYRTHRLRLERALEQERMEDALIETRALIDLLGERDHPYVRWLHNLERQLALLLQSAPA